jgi:hypothetical protein
MPGEDRNQPRLPIMAVQHGGRVRQMARQDQRGTTQEDEPGRVVGVIPIGLVVETGAIEETGLFHKPQGQVGRGFAAVESPLHQPVAQGDGQTP